MTAALGNTIKVAALGGFGALLAVLPADAVAPRSEAAMLQACQPAVHEHEIDHVPPRRVEWSALSIVAQRTAPEKPREQPDRAARAPPTPTSAVAEADADSDRDADANRAAWAIHLQDPTRGRHRRGSRGRRPWRVP